jgi:hypothetical protein
LRLPVYSIYTDEKKRKKNLMTNTAVVAVNKKREKK